MFSTSIVHPFDLPEIRNHIAQFLTRHDLAICSSLSRAWGQTCLPLLWRTLALVPSYSYPNVKLRRACFMRYSHFVKDLACDNHCGYENLSDPFPSFFNIIHCQNLETLALVGHVDNRANMIYRHRLTLLHLNLSKMITGKKVLERSDELWQAIASCPSLESLSVKKLHVSRKNWPLCWSLWSRLTHLGLFETSFSTEALTSGHIKDGDASQQLQPPPSQPLSLYELLAQEDPSRPTRLKTLELNLLHGLERQEDHLALLKFCPDLEKFVWFVNPLPFTGRQLGLHLEKQIRHCPRLIKVTLGADYRNEDILVRFVKSGTSLSLQELNLPRAQIELDTWNLLRKHHWSTIRTLDVSSFANGAVIQDIFCSLTGLESFTGYMIRGEDVIQDPRPWVCLGLKNMMVAIVISKDDGDGTQKVIMERLETLTRLQQLQLRPIYGQFGLQFRLTGFLGNLHTWRDFHTLIFQDVPQELTKRDVIWMVEKWPRLHSIIGEMHPQTTKDASLKKILMERRIQIRKLNTEVRIS